MKVHAVIECESCSTYIEMELKEGKNVIQSCSCGAYYGDEGGIVIIQSEKI